MFNIIETTDGRFIGHEFESNLQVGDIIDLSDDVVFEIQFPVNITGNMYTISNANYIILATEV